MNRFFVSPQAIQWGQIHFPDELAHQIRRVLRLQAGELVLVLDNSGIAYKAGIEYTPDGKVQGKILQSMPAEGEPAIQLSLYIGLTQREKFEWILQKGTEIGVSRFIPFISERSLVQKQDIAEKKGQRWQKILCEAAEQSHRGKIPLLDPVISFSESVKQAVQQQDCCLIPWEEERAVSLRSALLQMEKIQKIALMIGPEGGFSTAEVNLARQAGLISVTLGKRILRMETAAIAAAALVFYQFGEMD